MGIGGGPGSGSFLNVLIDETYYIKTIKIIIKYANENKGHASIIIILHTK